MKTTVTVAAKRAGVSKEVVYLWRKQGKINTYGNNPIMVDLAQVRRVAKTSRAGEKRSQIPSLALTFSAASRMAYSAKTAAAILGVHEKTLRRWVHRGRLKGYLCGERYRYYMRADVDRIKEEMGK